MALPRGSLLNNYRRKFQMGKIVFDARYTLGLTTTSEDGFDEKNKVISFMLGYSF